MSRPSARRRPTALRLTEIDQNYVLAATSVTFLAAGCSSYAYRYSRSYAVSPGYLDSTTLLSTGIILSGSALQRHFFPVRDCGTTLKLPGLGDTATVLVEALSIVAKFLAMQNLGVERAIAMLLPIECLARAQRGGFMTAQSSNRIVIGAAILLACASDFIAESHASEIFLGYLALGVAYFASSLSLGLQWEKGDMSFWSGLGLVCLAVLQILSQSSATPPTLLHLVVVCGGVASRAWWATQPKAIWTSLTVIWPAVVGICIFFGFNITHSVSWLQLLSYAALYYALFISIQTASALSAAQSTRGANKISGAGSSFFVYYISEILKEKESRDIFYFLLLNLTFMVVQMLYGIWTNSLGLISDSIHMLFDCLALAVGLVAAVMSKWPASQSHPFGFAKVEIISGFANGIFLVLISISIMIEALERLMEPPEMKTDQLLLISTLGLCVNLVGIFAFNHGHHHGHSHSHGHAHDHAANGKAEPLPTIHTPKVSRNDGTFDHLRGLQSPMPDFSNFAGFESPQPSSNGFDHIETSLERSRSHFTSLLPETNGHGHRPRSPVRRPASPLKFHEPVLADLAEVNERTPEKPRQLAFTGDHDHTHKHDHTPNHDHTHNHDHDLAHDHALGHNDSHSHKHNHLQVEPAKHSHARNLSYDLTAEHSHVHNSCSNHNHDHPHDHGHDHSHKHGHDHSHNMEGIFLHILADTLGSGGVIVSTILIRLFGWTGFDPLASIFIAVLIFLSVIPLLKSSFADLLMTLQDDQEYILREVLGEVSLISGVGGIPFIRFWVDGDQKMHGILTIRAGIDGDTDLVRQKVRRKLEDGVPNLVDVIVQVDRLE